MKFVIALGLVLLCVAADAKLLGALSVLPDLAFLFDTTGNSLWDVYGNNFTKLSDQRKNLFFETKLRGRVRAAAYILSEVGEDPQTFFFKGRRVFFLNATQQMVELPVQLKELFVNGPVKADAAFHVVNGSREVIGTNFILRNFIYECGLIGSYCTKSNLSDYAQFPNFLETEGRVAAALGLSNGTAVLFKQNSYAIIEEKGGVAKEFDSFWLRTGAS